MSEDVGSWVAPDGSGKGGVTCCASLPGNERVLGCETFVAKTRKVLSKQVRVGLSSQGREGSRDCLGHQV